MTKRRFARVGQLACATTALLALVGGASPAAAKTKTATLNQCVNTSTGIPDWSDTAPTPSAAVSFPISVPKFKGKPQTGVVTAFTSVGTRISHTDDGDLVLQLVSPGGQVIMLSNTRDGNLSGDGWGSGSQSCSGSLVLLGDGAPASILSPGNTTANSPITGSFRPEQPLSTFVGGPAAGNWTLLVADVAESDTGAINAASLNLTYKFQVKAKKKKKKK